MFKPIVVGVDGSREGAAAAEWAAREAVRRGLPLRIVHAWEGMPPDDTEADLPELKVPQYWARRVLRTTVEQLGARHPQLYMAAEQVRRPPRPALLAEAERAELLVLGSQGLGGMGGVLAGSVAMDTVAHARRPVVLVRAGQGAESEHLPGTDGATSTRTPFRDIALALDFGQPYDTLLEFAFRAAEFRKAPLRIVHAWHHPLARGVPSTEDRANARAAVQRDLEAALQPWREKFSAIPVEDSVTEGRAVHQIVKAARGAGLLVVGRRARRTAIGAHTGPVTHAAIHHATCPVAVVPHD
ncbi:universal stress protein [Streptomyces sp. NPDC050095]|uniref:universal stress protein n=1 Tax=unclassified Streptomyces TaxID=2593676 RepID=UPI003417FCC5